MYIYKLKTNLHDKHDDQFLNTVSGINITSTCWHTVIKNCHLLSFQPPNPPKKQQNADVLQFNFRFFYILQCQRQVEPEIPRVFSPWWVRELMNHAAIRRWIKCFTSVGWSIEDALVRMYSMIALHAIFVGGWSTHHGKNLPIAITYDINIKKAHYNPSLTHSH